MTPVLIRAKGYCRNICFNESFAHKPKWSMVIIIYTVHSGAYKAQLFFESYRITFYLF